MYGRAHLEIMPDTLRFPPSPISRTCPPSTNIYLSPSSPGVSACARAGSVKGLIRPPKGASRYFRVGLRVDEVKRRPARAVFTACPTSRTLLPLHPEERFILETTPARSSAAIIDLVAPVGRASGPWIVARRARQNRAAQKMTRRSSKLPGCSDLVLLVDERP